jgi:hypothetical protein
MAARGSSESKPLIITLVFVILALIGVSIYAYMLIGDKDRYEKVFADTVTKDAEAAKSRADYHKYVALRMKQYLAPLTDREKSFLADNKKKFDDDSPLALGKGDVDKQSYVEMFKQYDPLPENPQLFRDKTDTSRYLIPRDPKILNRDWGVEAPLKKVNSTFVSEVTALRDAVLKRDSSIATLTKERDQAKTELATEKTKRDDAEKAFAKILEVKSAAATGDVKAIADSVKPINDLNAKTLQDLNAALTAKQQAEAKYDAVRADLAKLQADFDKAKPVSPKKPDEVEKYRDPQTYEKPKGEITSIDRDGRVATVRLVSTRGLEVGQYLSVRGVNQQGKPLDDPRASLKVIRVIDGRFCEADIFYEKKKGQDRYNEPVYKGDQVYSIGWDPFEKKHVALIGVMDAAGQAREPGGFNATDAAQKMLEFKRMLEQQGVVVDAYVDMATFELKGKINVDTDFFVVGNIPDQAKVGEKRLADVQSALSSDASKKGVLIVAQRRFMNLMGIPVNRELP